MSRVLRRLLERLDSRISASAMRWLFGFGRHIWCGNYVQVCIQYLILIITFSLCGHINDNKQYSNCEHSSDSDPDPTFGIFPAVLSIHLCGFLLEFVCSSFQESRDFTILINSIVSRWEFVSYQSFYCFLEMCIFVVHIARFTSTCWEILCEFCFCFPEILS